MPTKNELTMLQALPLEIKVMKSLQRIREWVQHFGVDGVYVSFSGGKDSTGLLHLVRSIYPSVKAVFVDTGLEYPEIRAFVKSFENVEILRPKMNFRQVIEKYGYPVISKEVSECITGAREAILKGIVNQRLKQMNGQWTCKNGEKSQFNYEKWKPLLTLPFKISNMCCTIMKKNPVHAYSKQSCTVQITGQLASESRLRTQKWIQNGCNAFESKNPTSNPLSFWTEQDILQYISQNNLQIASVYGEIVPDDEIIGQIAFDNSLVKLRCSGCKRTGCMFCLYGMHLEKGETRLQRLHRTHPKIYDYVLGGGEFNSDGMWVPTDKGLGFKFVMDEVNRVMGKEIYRY